MKLKSMVVIGLPFLLLPSLASARTMSVKGASANFRESPSETAKIKFSADKFYPVEVIEYRKAGWIKVRDFEGEEAWVAGRLLTDQASVVISADKANIREAPNTTSDVLFKAERGEVFKIAERKEHWLRVVDAHGDGGWIRDDMTWGEADLEEKVQKADKTEKTEKADKADKVEKAKPEVIAPTKAKEAKPEKLLDKVAEKLEKVEASVPPGIAEPENLESLCRSYLDDVKEKVAPKPEKASAKPDKSGNKKVSAKPAAKPAKPAKPVEKKKK